MALTLLQRIFQVNTSESDTSSGIINEPEWAPKQPNFQLEQDQFRLLVIRESWHGHKSLLFDSHGTKQFHRKSDNESEFDAVLGEYGYKTNSACPDELTRLTECMLGTIPLTNQADVLKIHHFTTSYLWSLTHSATNEQSQNSKSSSNTSSYVQIHGTASANEFDSGVFSQKNSSTGLNLSSFSLPKSDMDKVGELSGYSSSVGGTSRPELLQLPTGINSTASKKIKISVGFVFLGQEYLQNILLEVKNFVRELLQRTRIHISKILANDNRRKAFIPHMYLLYIRTYETILSYMSIKRLHRSAWHLTNHRHYLAYHFISLKKMFDTKEKAFFLR